MTTAGFAIVLVIILAVIVVVLNKKSVERDNSNSSSISDAKYALNKRCDDISKDVSAKDKNTRVSLDALRQDVNRNAKQAGESEERLSRRIDSLNEETASSISKAKKEATGKAKDTYSKATQYADQKAADAIKYADELRDNIVEQLEERISTLTSSLDSLKEENAHLQEELTKVKKELYFYTHKGEIAENLVVKEDPEERRKALEAVRQQILSEDNNSVASDVTKKENTVVIERFSQEIVKPQIASTPQEKPSIPFNQDSSGESEKSGEKRLDNEQAFARKYMQSTTENIFITGKAGTGKSFLLDAFRISTRKSNIVLAPTGIAALNVNGATLHSTFGYSNLVNLDIDDITEENLQLKSEKRQVLQRVATIIIDEISMVRADTFDKIDRILKVINKSNLPFGGKQMLVFGDLFQLPPVTKGQEYKYLYDRYGGVFFFHSNAYKAGNFKFIELTHNHRQKSDDTFFAILNRIREGKATDSDIAALNARYTPNEDILDAYTSLFPTKAEAERVNREHMEQLQFKEYKYKAKVILDKKTNKNNSIESVFPISEELCLRENATVMMVANDIEGRWVNGSQGFVEELSQEMIKVRFSKERVYEVQPIEFDEQEIVYANGKITYEKVFSVMQYPIVPAYAITIHKSQGQTYGNIMCDIDGCFANGQAYVALSRCKSLEGLHLKSMISPASIKVDHEVLDFYREQMAKDLLHG